MLGYRRFKIIGLCHSFIAPNCSIRLTQKPPVKKENQRDSKPIAGSVNSAAKRARGSAQGQERGGRRRSFNLREEH